MVIENAIISFAIVSDGSTYLDIAEIGNVNTETSVFKYLEGENVDTVWNGIYDSTVEPLIKDPPR